MTENLCHKKGRVLVENCFQEGGGLFRSKTACMKAILDQTSEGNPPLPKGPGEDGRKSTLERETTVLVN